MGSRAQTLQAELKNPAKPNAKNLGTIFIHAESLQESNDMVAWQIAGTNLKNKGCCEILPIHYFVQRQSRTDPKKFHTVYQSKMIEGTNSPIYAAQRLGLTQIANADKNAPIRISFMTSDYDETYKAVGHSDLTVASILDQRSFEVKSNSGGNAGKLEFRQFSLVERPSFVDILRSGMQINLAIAIDYTQSNGNISDPRSLHSTAHFNQYEQAISSVGAILEPYSHTGNFPVFGFGGIPRHMGNNSVSHCFPLNGNPANPGIQGINNVLQTYRQNLQTIGLAGPTFFGGVLQAFNQYAQQTYAQNVGGIPVYNVLLILTDGCIHDMDQTINHVIDASEYPTSIIVVGVGEEDFSLMDQLDSDEALLRSGSGRVAKRDIVQFVAFQDCVKKGTLAEEVLKEVPEQVVGWAEMANYKPVKIESNPAMYQA